MKLDSRFASKAESVADAPEPFREQLRAHLKPKEEVSLLVCAPAYASLREKYPGSMDFVWLSTWSRSLVITPLRVASFRRN